MRMCHAGARVSDCVGRAGAPQGGAAVGQLAHQDLAGGGVDPKSGKFSGDCLACWPTDGLIDEWMDGWMDAWMD